MESQSALVILNLSLIPQDIQSTDDGYTSQSSFYTYSIPFMKQILC